MEPEEYKEHKQETSSYSEPQATSRQSRWAIPVAIALLGAAAFGVGYGLRQQSIVGQMTARQNENSAQMAQMRTQIDSLNAKLGDAMTSLNNSNLRESSRRSRLPRSPPLFRNRRRKPKSPPPLRSARIASALATNRSISCALSSPTSKNSSRTHKTR